MVDSRGARRTGMDTFLCAAIRLPCVLHAYRRYVRYELTPSSMSAFRSIADRIKRQYEPK